MSDIQQLEQQILADVSGAADEAALSRIWAGQHTRIDDQAGRQLGRQVAGVAIDDLHLATAP